MGEISDTADAILKYGDLSRQQIVDNLKELGAIENGIISWPKLCSLTEFDSFATALAYGFGWNENGGGLVSKMPENYLRMCLFNITNFPKITQKGSESCQE